METNLKNNNKSWLPLIIIALASFVIALDSTFMNVAISSLVVDLNTTVQAVQTIITFYTLITASMMLVGAKLQDILGQKKVFLIGAFIYGIGTLTASLSINTFMLFTGWSLLEGIGGALMTPATLSIVSSTYDGKERTKALSVVAGMAGIAAAIGPLFGGYITIYSWRIGFAIELLVILFIFAFSKSITDFPSKLSKDTFDKVGAFLSIIGLITLVIGILSLNSSYTNYALIFIVGAIILLTLFVYYERKREYPLLDVSILKTRNLLLGTIIRILISIIMAGAIFSISIFLQTVMKTDSFTTGLTLLPVTIGMLIFAISAPKLASKRKRKSVIALGFIISIMGILLLNTEFGIYTKLIDIVPGLFLLGAGLGLSASLCVDISLVGTDKDKENEATGVISTGQTLGIAIGTAIIGTLLILGGINGLHQAKDLYAPEMTNDQFKNNAELYLEKVGHVDYKELGSQKSIISNIVNVVIKDSMKFTLNIMALISFIGLILTLFLKEKK